MKNLFFAFLLIAAVVIGVGTYRGWFTVDKAKIEQDEAAAMSEIHDLEQQVKDKTSDLKDSVKERK